VIDLSAFEENVLKMLGEMNQQQKQFQGECRIEINNSKK